MTLKQFWSNRKVVSALLFIYDLHSSTACAEFTFLPFYFYFFASSLFGRKTFNGVINSVNVFYYLLASRNLQQKLMAFQARLNARKRRKARTCFTNQQIFELERRFVYQKYLSPSDRDEIAHSLGISGAQVITWFQNRRAKFRRDLEELKSDVHAAKIMDSKQVNRLYKRLEI